jgi:hypothetical protein
MVGIVPKTYIYPMTGKWDEIGKRFLAPSPEISAQTLISNYVEYYPELAKIGKLKSNLVRLSFILLLLIILSEIW